jgi:hypothetical protein
LYRIAKVLAECAAAVPVLSSLLILPAHTFSHLLHFSNIGKLLLRLASGLIWAPTFGRSAAMHRIAVTTEI